MVVENPRPVGKLSPGLRARRRGALRSALAPWAIAAFAVAAYLNSLDGGFVWDDRFLVVDNPRLHSFAGLVESWTHDYVFATETNLAYGYYRPIAALSLWLDYRLWGASPFGFHLTNVLLHAACAALVVVTARRLGLAPGAAALAGALFAVHPIHTESVSWIAGRTDVLALLLALGSLLAFLAARSPDARRPGAFRALSFGLFAAGLLAKEMAAVVPLWIAGVVLFGERAGGRSAARAASPYFAVLGTYLFVRFAVLDVAGPEIPDEHNPLHALASAPWTLLRYLSWLTWPAELSAYVQNPYVAELRDPRFWGSILVLTALAAALVRLGRRNRQVALFGAMLLVSFPPVLNLRRLSGPMDMGNLMAERFLYLPSFPFVALVALGVSAVLVAAPRRSVRLAVATVVALSLSACGVRTWTRTRDWRSDQTLFARETQRTPGAPLPWIQLSHAALREGAVSAADLHLRRAEALAPGSPGVLAMRAQWLVFAGRPAEALPLQQRVVSELGEKNLAARNNLAFLYRATGQPDRALPLLRTLTDTTPRYADPWFNLGETHRALGDLTSASTALHRFHALEPDDPRGLEALGEVEAAAGRRDEVEALYREALARGAPPAPTWNALALLRHRLGDPAAARAALARALASDPDYGTARYNLALMLDEAGERGAATAELDLVRRRMPESGAGRAAAALLAAWSTDPSASGESDPPQAPP